MAIDEGTRQIISGSHYLAQVIRLAVQDHGARVGELEHKDGDTATSFMVYGLNPVDFRVTVEGDDPR